MSVNPIKTVRLSDWAQNNGMTEQAALNLARRRKVAIARFQSIAFVDEAIMNRAFTDDFALQQQRMEDRRNKAKVRRAQMKAQMEELERLKLTEGSTFTKPEGAASDSKKDSST